MINQVSVYLLINYYDIENNIEVAKNFAIENKQTVTVISKINGWLTVDPQTMSRKECYENRKRTDIQKPSLMAPQWMQVESKRDEERLKMFKVVSTNGGNMRIERNRVILTDKEDLPKSIFNAGSIRHNFIQKPDAVYHTARNITSNPVRLIEWKEDTTKQGYDKKVITSKIGHL